MTKRPIIRESVLIISSATNKSPIVLVTSYIVPVMRIGAIIMIIPIPI